MRIRVKTNFTYQLIPAEYIDDVEGTDGGGAVEDGPAMALVGWEGLNNS